jgi:DtxR family Mn-dependent transcriptional regulator
MTPDPLISLIIAGLLTVVGVLLFWPDRGFFWSWQRARQTTEQVLIEDALKHAYDCEMSGHSPTVDSIAGSLNVTDNQAAHLLEKMEARDLLHRQADRLSLTVAGREYALQVIRAHRLWERYLADETGYDQSEWHALAHRHEHTLLPAEADVLSARLGHPTHDPHGDPIPTETGQMMPHGGRPLSAVETDRPLRIVHVEDEPQAVYAQLVALGLHPGMEIRVIERTPERIRYWDGLDEHVLAPVVATNVSVVPLPAQQDVGLSAAGRLSHLKLGEKAQVVSLSHAYPRPERHRLMDLGILPGTVIEAEMTSPGGDPTAYRVRDALIALRREQADLIFTTPVEEAA